jgi:uncharacterized protein
MCVSGAVRDVAFAISLCSLLGEAGAQTTDAWEHSGLAEQASLQREIMVPMRDHVRLSTAVILPNQRSGSLPTVLTRTPYNKDVALTDWWVKDLVSRGYAFVIQNERGTGWSEGKHQFLAGARNDGYDTLSWIANQPWSNGKVGTIGCSSAAEDQLALAAANHPAHKAMIAMGPGAGIGELPGLRRMGGFYEGGVPMIEWAHWYSGNGSWYRPQLAADISSEQRARLADMYSPWPLSKGWKLSFRGLLSESELELPSQDILRRIGAPEGDFDTFIRLSPANPKWRELDYIREGDHPRVPALYIDAWHDSAGTGTVKLFEYVQHTPNQFLIVAPTGHCEMLKATERTVVGERLIGDARYDYVSLIENWFDHWLKDEPNDVLNRPKIQMFMMGANAWKTYSEWPVAGAKPLRLFLHSKGRANSMLGDGRLSAMEPANENPDAFVSDPLHPVPSSGGGDDDQVQDQSAVEMRHDVLVYSTDVLREGVALTGEVQVVVYVSSSTPDADLAIKLVDIYPDGKAYNVSDTMLRLRYRDGFAKPALMKSGEVYRAELAGMLTSNFFPPGHRIRIQLAGSNFPLYERNLQTGGRNYDETQSRVATIRIHHEREHASFIEFPVL